MVSKVIVFKKRDQDLAVEYAELQVTSDDSCQRALDGAKWARDTRLAIGKHPGLLKAYEKATEALEAVKELRNKPMGQLEKLEKALRDAATTWNTAKEKKRLLAEAEATTQARQTVIEIMAQAPEVIGDEEYVFDVPEAARTSALLEHVTVSLPSTKVGDSRRYWRPKIHDLRALAQAWVDGRVPADVFELRPDGTVHVLAAVERHAALLQLTMDWPGVTNDFEDRPYLGGER